MDILTPTGGGMASGFDVERFVNDLVNEFVRGSKLPLDPTARYLVVDPARQHRLEIERQVRQQPGTTDQIADAVRTVLRNALDLALQRDKSQIDEECVREAMKWECRYFGWC
jgi:hypothetical protein